MKWQAYAAPIALLVSACSHHERIFGDASEVGGAAGDNGAGASGESNAGASGESSAGASAGGAGDGGECLAEPACSPGQVDPAEQACGPCNTGKQSRTRVCATDACGWGEWSEWTTCSGATAACTPGQTMPCENADPCGQRVCSSSCTWDACQPNTPNGCLSIRQGQTKPGSNYKCCGTAGHWRFCLPTYGCQWSASCVSCAQGAPDYCTECY